METRCTGVDAGSNANAMRCDADALRCVSLSLCDWTIGQNNTLLGLCHIIYSI